MQGACSQSVPQPMSHPVPNTINPLAFAAARAAEIRTLMRTSYKKNGQQTIPKHMRRRAASHNPRRIPARFRPFVKPPDDIKPKRKRVRRDKRVHAERTLEKRAVAGDQWLETHVWHAKRFHMSSLFGFKLAMQRCDKGCRSSWKFYKSHCVVHDASYWSSIIVERVDSTTPPSWGTILSSLFHIFRHGGSLSPDGSSELYCSVYLQDGCYLGPMAFWLHGSLLHLWMHPTCRVVMETTLKQCSALAVQHASSGSLKRLQLRGPHVYQVWEHLLRGGVAAGWKETPPITGSILTLPSQAVYAHRPTATMQWKAEIDALVEGKMEDTRTAASSTTPPWTSFLTPPIPVMENHNNNDNNNSSGGGDKGSSDARSFQTMTLTVIAVRENALDVVVEAGQLAYLMHALVSQGTMPVGQNEVRAIVRNRGSIAYPWDAPDAPGYAEIVAREQQDLQAAKQKKPKSKISWKDNFLVNCAPALNRLPPMMNTFLQRGGTALPAGKAATSVLVHLRHLQRGLPRAGSFLWAEKPGGPPTIEEERPPAGEGADSSSSWLGTVIWGGFVNPSGAGAGLAAVKQTDMLQQQGEQSAWIADHASMTYHPVMLMALSTAECRDLL